ncbi:MAG: DUF2225 domain-containing protein [Treponema sp.]|nr:DUF2225 domain-containing protein [Treponema sp.]
MAKSAFTKKPAISYWSKTKVLCPVCQKEFQREEMLSGSGRMIAGDLTDELRRNYEPSKKYGMIYPLLYAVGACPKCHMALLWSDFKEVDDKNSLRRIHLDEENRRNRTFTIFPYYDLIKERSLLDGAAIYYLALQTYELLDVTYAPTFKRGLICLRLAWLCRDLDRVMPNHNYNYIAEVFYRKATFFYEQTVLNEMSGTESITVVNNFGPDIDKNYGYDGLIYLGSLLEYKYGQKEDLPLRYKKLDAGKRSIARIFGLGKSSKNKPGPLLEHARNLYDTLTAELKAANTIDFEFNEDDDGESES